MEINNRTIVGVFSDITDAKRATDELHSLGFSSARLVENDQDAKFTGTAEQAHTGSYDSGIAGREHKQSGISAFFARLFGFDDDRPTWNLSSDSEAYFQNAYNNRNHLVIARDCDDTTVCREVITRFGGVIEDQGSQYYQQELYRDQGLTGSRMDNDYDLQSDRDMMNRDRDLDSERVMDLREERLDVHKDRRQTGEVQIRKELVTENKTIEVPVTREEIVVERRPLDGTAVTGSIETRELGADKEEIRIPVSEEFVHIDKKVVPREEIRVSKEKITETKKVSEDVRREEAKVDSTGRVEVKDNRGNTAANRRATAPRSNDSIQPQI